MSEHQLDARNLLCPLPVIKVQNKVKSLQDGDILKVVCTDPGALYDIPSWCRMYGHSVMSSEQIGREIIIQIQVNV